MIHEWSEILFILRVLEKHLTVILDKVARYLFVRLLRQVVEELQDAGVKQVGLVGVFDEDINYGL